MKIELLDMRDNCVATGDLQGVLLHHSILVRNSIYYCFHRIEVDKCIFKEVLQPCVILEF